MASLQLCWTHILLVTMANQNIMSLPLKVIDKCAI